MDGGDIAITNGCVITGRGPVFPDGFVHMSGGRIAAVGPSCEAQASKGVRVLDAGGRYVLPGFINLHTHLYSSLALGMPALPARSFGAILKAVWWRLDRALSLDDIHLSALIGGVSSLRAGVTTLFDHHASYGAIRGSLARVSQALSAVGVRASLCFEISDRAGKRARDEAIEESASWLEGCARHRGGKKGLAQGGMVGLHASMTLSDGTLDAALELMEMYGAGAHVHVAECDQDVRVTRRLNGLSPAVRLARRGILRKGTLAVHCVRMAGADIAALGASGAAAVHCPLSNLGNAVGIAPILKLRRRGTIVAIGTDGFGASIAGDTRLASSLHGIAARDARVGFAIARDALWGAAPSIASAAFGFKVGSLRPGAAADVIISDARPRTPVTAKNAWSHILLAALDSPVRTAIVGGRIRMRDFKVLGIDEAALAAEARASAERLWRRLA